jgi:hypothetical protein
MPALPTWVVVSGSHAGIHREILKALLLFVRRFREYQRSTGSLDLQSRHAVFFCAAGDLVGGIAASLHGGERN